MTFYIKTKDRGWQPWVAAIPVCSNHNNVEGCFRNTDQSAVQSEMIARADQYGDDVAAYIRGDLSKEQIFRAFNAPVYGAFGEKL